MEFERALFRIHQRMLYSEPIRQLRLRAERGLPLTIAALAACLALLHWDYVGQARCLPDALKRAGLWNSTGEEPALPDDALLALALVHGDELLDVRLHMEEEPRPPPPAAGAAGGAPLGIAAGTENGTASGPSWRATVAAIQVDPRSVLTSYRFAFDREVVLMRPKVFEGHSFRVYNVSLPVRCVAPSPLLAQSFRLFDGFDGIVINELAYTFRSRGYLERVDGAAEVETWVWSAEQVEAASPRDGRPLAASLARKAALLLKSGLTFLLISAVTGFFIRVAVNGSAVLMFPIALLAQALGWGSGRMSVGVLTRSFPWVGVHLGVLRGAGRPVGPLLKAHLYFLLIQSFAYLSCNLAWRVILYRKSSPEGFEERVFSLCSILELFNLIFVRSAHSSVLFPKCAFACMVYLHFYMFCSLYPFHTLALATCTAACAYAMVYCLNHFEEPALRSDPFAHTTPTAAHPRALYMPQLSPSWSLESAPLWTMFFPPDPPGTYPEEAMRDISNEEYLMP